MALMRRAPGHTAARLERLERAAQPAPTPEQAREAAFRRAIDVLVDSLPGWAWEAIERETDLGELLRRRVSDLGHAFAYGRYAGPLRVPAVIWEAYREHPEALPLHECACGLHVPLLRGQWRRSGARWAPVVPARSLFPSCPGCGGPTGYPPRRWPRSIYEPEVYDALAASVPAWAQPELERRVQTPAGHFNRTRLRQELDELTGEVVTGAYIGPLVLPAAVCRVYVDEPEAMSLHDCADCGFSVPMVAGICRTLAGGVPDHRPARSFFPECPVCGGKVGYCARWHALNPGRR